MRRGPYGTPGFGFEQVEVERYDGDDPEGPRLYPSESSGTGWTLEDD